MYYISSQISCLLMITKINILGQFFISVKSAFSWCVDSDLLEMHNLISPRDYLPKQKTRVSPPPAPGTWPSLLDPSQIINDSCFFIWVFLSSCFLSVKFNLAKPTIAYAMHVSKKPQDDGYTLTPSPEKTVLNKSHFSLTLESSLETPKRGNTPSEVRSQQSISHSWKD